MEEHQEVSFLETVVKAIVSNPEAVKVTRTTDEMGVLLELMVDASDMGLLIGRSGSTAKAIRSLVRIVGMKNNARVNLRILEPDGTSRPRQVMPAASQNKNKSVDEVVDDIDI